MCFERKSDICIAKFGNLGANGVKGSKFPVENVIFGIADPDLSIHYVMYNVAEWSRCVWSPGRGGAGQRCFVCHASRHATRHASTCATIVSRVLVVDDGGRV